MPLVMPQAAARLSLLCSSPHCRVICATTVPPRVSLGKSASIRERELDVVDEAPPRELDLVLGDGVLRETLHDAEQRVARGLERSIPAQVRAEVGEARLALLPLGAENRARQARLDERLVQP